MTTTLDALMAAILDEPDDDLARLVYADALDDAGDSAQADFIRAQIALSRDDTPAMRRATYDAALLGIAVWYPIPAGWTWYVYPANPSYSHHHFVTIARGFPDTVHCPTEQWRTHGPALVRQYPIRTVRLTDREPWKNSETLKWSFGWGFGMSPPDLLGERGEMHALPGWMHQWLGDSPLQGFPDAASAHAALSRAAIAWAKAAEPAEVSCVHQ